MVQVRVSVRVTVRVMVPVALGFGSRLVRTTLVSGPSCPVQVRGEAMLTVSGMARERVRVAVRVWVRLGLGSGSWLGLGSGSPQGHS